MKIIAEKLLSRDDFRESVFERDNRKCVICSSKAQDAHHIIERRLFRESHEKSGYFINNGASLCGSCHIKAETTEIDAQELRDIIGIKKIVLPAHLYEGQRYDKWGNPIQPTGMRLKGELFYDESVQKILAQGNMLERFSDLIRAPRTYHLPWSAGMHNDDRMMPSTRYLEEQEIIVTRKMDGENTSIYQNALHARSPDSKGHVSRNKLKAWAATWQHDIPEKWRIGGENVTAEHSIHYQNLPHIFLGFHVWNEKNICLSWDETLEWFELLGITPVKLLYRGPFIPDKIKSLYNPKTDYDKHEGYVVRPAAEFPMTDYPVAVGKYVRENHVQTIKHHWASQPFVPNGINE